MTAGGLPALARRGGYAHAVFAGLCPSGDRARELLCATCMSRILVYEPHSGDPEWSQHLAADGHDVVVCAGREALFDAMALRRPDLVIYVLGDLALDLGVLWVVRRMAATMPIILLGGPADLEARRSVQELKPTYFGVFPLEPAELEDAVRGALAHRPPRPLAS